jgi:hypothetical protein
MAPTTCPAISKTKSNAWESKLRLRARAEGSGVAERFIRTLKENLLWVRTFDTIEELRAALVDFTTPWPGNTARDRASPTAASPSSTSARGV